VCKPPQRTEIQNRLVQADDTSTDIAENTKDENVIAVVNI
jgi:hypothetical protein